MSLHRLWAIMRKEFRHIQRDRRLLFLVLLSPAVMLLAFAYLFSLDGTSAQFTILDQDHSPQSRALAQALTTDPDLIFVGEAQRYNDLRGMIQSGDIKLGLVLPPGFGARLAAGRTATVQLVGDGTDTFSTSSKLALLSARMKTWAEPFQRAGDSYPVEIRTLVWYNPDLKSIHSMAPALLAVVLILPAMAVALALARERELGSFESLASTPVRASEYMLGKLIPYVVYGLAGAALAVGVVLYWFEVPLRGSPLDLAGFIVLYLWAALGISMFLANFMSTQSTALRAILLIFLVPSFFLTGLVLPVDEASKLTAYSLPATHFMTISRGVFLKGLGWQALGFNVFILLIMGALAIGFSIITFRKRVH